MENKKFKVSFAFDTEEQIAGIMPRDNFRDELDDYLVAESGDAAISMAMDYMCSLLDENNCTYSANAGRQEITLAEDGIPTERYYDFRAVAVG